jgi:hypothetical protein
VEDEDGLEPPGHGVLDEPLEARALIGSASGLEVEVLVDDVETMLLGIAGDGLALSVGGVAAALLLCGLTDVPNGPPLLLAGRTRRSARRAVERDDVGGAAASSRRTTRRRRHARQGRSVDMALL